MAGLFTRSRPTTHLLIRKIGLLENLKQVFGYSSLPHLQITSPKGPIHGTGKNPDAVSDNPMTLFSVRRFASIRAGEEHATQHDNDENRVLDFPGGGVTLTAEMNFISESPETRTHCYRVLDNNGQPIAGSSFQQYREPGILLWRGFTLQEFANQCFGNKADYGKGRQMPIHYGSKRLNYFTISSPIATQIPHAVGAAYSLKMDQKNACTVTYFGDGGTSEGDFHAAMNFAAVMEVPVIFFCRNNGWAISTPISEQFRSDGTVVKGPAYGIQSIRVDGNDALAVYNAVRAAREMAISGSKPIFIEALTYRVSHHSTSDDSTKYRSIDEIEYWRTNRDPVTRFRKWVESNGWWNDAAESELRSNVRNKLLHAIQYAERAEKPPLADMFTDVYNDLPTNLREQERLLRQTVEKHPEDYPPEVPI
ncbi:2-oxoisovalerate dehydrogenase subunit alpha 2, mitochondrial-like isoform X2 [Magnolia sinica]|uniref:2-oxoisovalerate dehydrogenase subunit alpha 2, mitochondrial-like isoform X2 n=1 Tax=Magnolia sinica TaxID=86752 RepID=UPI002659B146|nr:2-oxoisovalerate dehydrogenase subunit alpha 2, mitochondrial-like isoform X2 [Magnolia sinica]